MLDKLIRPANANRTPKGDKRKVYEVVCTNEKCFIYQGVTRFQDTPGIAIRLWNKRIKPTQSK